MYVASPAASEEAPTTAKIATAGLEALRLWFQDARALARAVSAVRAVCFDTDIVQGTLFKFVAPQVSVSK